MLALLSSLDMAGHDLSDGQVRDRSACPSYSVVIGDNLSSVALQCRTHVIVVAGRCSYGAYENGLNGSGLGFYSSVEKWIACVSLDSHRSFTESSQIEHPKNVAVSKNLETLRFKNGAPKKTQRFLYF